MNFAEPVRTFVVEQAQANKFSGVVALWQADEPLLEYACGLAHRGWQIANRLDTRSRQLVCRFAGLGTSRSD